MTGFGPGTSAADLMRLSLEALCALTDWADIGYGQEEPSVEPTVVARARSKTVRIVVRNFGRAFAKFNSGYFFDLLKGGFQSWSC